MTAIEPVDTHDDHLPDIQLDDIVPQAPPAVPGRPPRALLLGVSVACAGVVGMFGALTSAYFSSRPYAADWPTDGFELSTYSGFAFFCLIVLSSVFVQWGSWAVHHDARRQAIGAYGALALVYLAFLNLGWFELDGIGHGVGETDYTQIVWTVLLAVGAVAFVALIATMVTLAKATLGLLGRTDNEPAQALNVLVHTVSAVAILSYWLIWYVK